jgi:hypothetical protein
MNDTISLVRCALLWWRCRDSLRQIAIARLNWWPALRDYTFFKKIGSAPQPK